jgi:hypothetical protein
MKRVEESVSVWNPARRAKYSGSKLSGVVPFPPQWTNKGMLNRILLNYAGSSICRSIADDDPYFWAGNSATTDLIVVSMCCSSL